MVGVRHVLAGELRDGVRPARLADRADRRDLALAARCSACVPKTSLVEKSTNRSSVSLRRERGLERVVGADHVHAHRAHRALEHGVDAGDRGAVDEVRRARARAPSAARASRTSAWMELKFGWSASVGARERVAVEVVDGDDLCCASTSSRASVVAMKPAPPVMKIRLPSSAIGASLARCGLVDPTLGSVARGGVGTGRGVRRPRVAARAPAASSTPEVARATRSRSSPTGRSRARRCSRELVVSTTSSRVSRCSTTASRAARGAARARASGRASLTAPPGTDERAIEIPWCLARYDGEPRRARRRLRVRRACLPRRAGRRSARRARGRRSRRRPRCRGSAPCVADVRELPFDDALVRARALRSRRWSTSAATTSCTASRPSRRRRRARPCAPRAAPGARRRRPPARHACRRRAGERLRAGRCSAAGDWIALFEARRLPRLRGRALRARRRRLAIGRRRCRADARYGARGPGASAVLCAELRPSTLTARMRLGIRDRRYPDDVRRVTG